MIAAPDMDKLNKGSAAKLTLQLQTLTPIAERQALAALYFHDFQSWDRALSEAGNSIESIDAWMAEVENVMASAGGFIADNSTDWGVVVPFKRTEGKPWPLGVLCDWLEAFVEQEAEATQTPEDMSALLGLSVIATAVHRKFEVEVDEGYIEPLNIFTATAMPPGTRKSTVYSAMTEPVYEYERDQAQDIQVDRIRALDAIEVMKKRHEKLRRSAAKMEDPEEIKTAQAESADLAQEIATAEKEAPRAIRLAAADVTPEKVAELMSQNGERIALMNAEGGEVFEMMRGRYASNGRGNIEIYLKGHAGDHVTVDRKGDQASINMAHPCITMALTVQPAVISSLSSEGTFRDRGLLGRFLYSFPANMLGLRKSGSQPVEEAVARNYSDKIKHLLGCKGDRAPIQLTPAARDLWRKFWEEIEGQLSPDAALGSMTDWAGKLPGAVARIAGLLHCGESAGKHCYPGAEPINVETMRQAIVIGRYLLDHAKVAFSIMGHDPSDAAAMRAWRCICRIEETDFTERELWQRVKGGVFSNMADVRAALRNLESRGHIMKGCEPAAGTVGRNSSPRWVANPNEVGTPRSPRPRGTA